jgi:hypothetical protein
MLAFAQAYQQLCAKLNDSEIFDVDFGRRRATMRRIFDHLRIPVIQFCGGFHE